MSSPLLIAFDGSEGAHRTIGVAASLFPRQAAVVLAVAAPVTVAEAVAETLGPAQGYEELNESQALEIAAEGAEQARRRGLTATARGELAVPTWQGIVDVADEIGAAAIVVGSSHRSAAHELFEGSLSSDLISHAHRPVLIVPRSYRGEEPRQEAL